MNGAEVITLKEYFLKLLTEMEERTIIRFESMEKALVLARDLAQADKELARNILEHRLIGMNEFQKRMDKLEGTFATKDQLNSLSKLLYIGVGIVITLQFLFRFLIT